MRKTRLDAIVAVLESGDGQEREADPRVPLHQADERDDHEGERRSPHHGDPPGRAVESLTRQMEIDHRLEREGQEILEAGGRRDGKDIGDEVGQDGEAEEELDPVRGAGAGGARLLEPAQQQDGEDDPVDGQLGQGARAFDAQVAGKDDQAGGGEGEAVAQTGARGVEDERRDNENEEKIKHDGGRPRPRAGVASADSGGGRKWDEAAGCGPARR